MNQRVRTKELLADRVRERQAMERRERARWATLVAPALERPGRLELLASIGSLLPWRRTRSDGAGSLAA
jgi:hypothetical protein